MPRYSGVMSNLPRAKIAGAVLIVLAALAHGASAAKPPVVIGALYNLTGGQQDLDVPSSRGAKLAVDEANKAGGVLGRPVELILRDGETKPKVIARETASLFRQQPALAGLIGLSDTDMVLAAAPIAAQNKRVFLTSGATSPELPRQVPRYLFLACFGDNVQAAAGAEWAAKTLKARTVVVLYKQTSSYARLLHGYFQTRFKQLGGKVLAVRPYTFATVKDAAKGLPQADLVYFAAQPDDVLAGVSALRGAGVAAPILGGDGLDIGDAWQQAGQAGNIFFHHPRLSRRRQPGRPRAGVPHAVCESLSRQGGGRLRGARLRHGAAAHGCDQGRRQRPAAGGAPGAGRDP